MAILSPFQLLEINVISAQDLEIVSKGKMKTYATARVNPGRKLTSSVDTEGHNNPTWNDKFVFRVDEDFLRRDTSAVMIEIFSVNWLKDTLIGSVRVLVGNLIPPPTRPFHHNHKSGMRFVALQVRRPSGRPQGILNIGVTLLDSSMRSMPLYSQLSASAVGYRDLMEDDNLHNNQNNNNNDNGDEEPKSNPPVVKPILRRSKSERSERVTFENASIANNSIVAIARKKDHVIERESSILSISDVGNPFMKRTKKASSVISGAELREKPRKSKGRKGKSGSVLSDSVVSKDSTAFQYFKNEKVKPKEKEVINHVGKMEVAEPVIAVHEVSANKVIEEKGLKKSVHEVSANKVIEEKGLIKSTGVFAEPTPIPVKEKPRKVIGKSAQKFIPYEYPVTKANQKYGFKQPKKPTSSIWSDSEVGPSPSEMAAIVAEKRYPLDDGQSSVLDGWSLDESEEGLRSKLDRWRTELPPIYDRQFSSSYQSSVQQRPQRRHSDGGPGLFSCFGNICGIECQCVCGKPSAKKHPKRFRRTPSFGSRSFR